jgi:hypothetical protein
MEHSEKIDALAAALAKAQGKITGAKKDSENPFFTSKYADLASCWDACRDAIAENGLAVVQTTKRGNPVTIKWDTTNPTSGDVTSYSVDTEELVVTTTLLHESGQWLASDLPMIPRDASPQGMGSALTYGRRYGLTAMLGIAQVDDDGNAASGRTNGAMKGAHRPQGDIPKSVPTQAAQDTANRMHATLHEGDIEETIRQLRVLDLHEELNKQQEVYIAAADLLTPKDRAAFKTYVSLAKAAEKADKAASGKRF